MVETTIKRLIRDVPDFPKPGILFKDVTPLLADAPALARVVDALAEPYRQNGKPTVDRVLGIESRGFIFGTPVAQRLGVGFAPIRKPGKLPWKTVSESYALEYGEDRIELHEDAVHEGERVLIVDDLLATGGTLTAACRLVERLGGQVAGCAVVIELGFLDGRKRLGERPLHSLVTF
ncbi:MAG: adenine phosphoribosyltransferase [Planctomycetes bacterium]|nr:adenine phosphoribosyltransferase [Planctomycetota bacterium]